MKGWRQMGTYREIESFIAQWPEAANGCRELFQDLYRFLRELDGTEMEYHARPGITYSLRGTHAGSSDRPLFVMVDVIEDDPRWLSVCFYEEMVTDPEERGDSVPGGLLGEDGVCFDVDAFDETLLSYIKQRITEASQAGGK